MKKMIVGFILSITAVSAIAACPAHMPYGCRQGWDGKMICGCGVR